MARTAGTVTLRFEAGTSGFVADIGKAKAAVRDFGATGRSSMIEAGATVKALQGNVAGSERAMAHFLESTLHLGPALSAAFNVVGPVYDSPAGKVSVPAPSLVSPARPEIGLWMVTLPTPPTVKL